MMPRSLITAPVEGEENKGETAWSSADGVLAASTLH